MSIPHHIKRELLLLEDQIEMAEASGDEARIDHVSRAALARLDEIELELAAGAMAKAADSGASFQTRLGALRNGLW